MERKLHQEPQFDLETLRQKCDAWKSHQAGKVVIEWSTGTGPNLFYYPAGQRGEGVKWTVPVETYNYNELYADFIEQKLIPHLREVIQARGLTESSLCVDLQPLQIQRQRRRQIERAQTSVSSHH